MPSSNTTGSPPRDSAEEMLDEGFGSLDSDTDTAHLIHDTVSESTQTDRSSVSSRESSSLSDDGMETDEDMPNANIGLVKAVEGKIWSTVSQVLRNCSSKNEVSTQTICSPIQRQANILAHDVICMLLKKQSTVAQTKVTQTMRRCVLTLLENHSILFNSMVTKLSITPETGYDTFVGVVGELFEEGAMNWGRVVAIYAFAGRLAMYCQDKGMNNYAVEIAHFLGTYVGDHLGPFIRENNGWDGLVEAFPEETDVENAVWKTLLVTGIGLGIATGATLLISH